MAVYGPAFGATVPDAASAMKHADVRAADSAFASFWMGGFEGADHRNLSGLPLDMVAATGHAAQLARDYALARSVGIQTVRESVGWRVCAPLAARQMDFTRLRAMAEAAQGQGVQVLWTLMHYGTPPDVQVMDADFSERYADFAAAAVRTLRACGELAPICNPINEIGFLAWALAARALVAGACSERDGYVVKLALVRAALLGMQAIRAEAPGARFVHIEPMIHVVAPHGRADLAQAASDFCGYQWQVWDLLMGHAEPQLGGAPSMADWIGINHYHDAQWEIGSGTPLSWPEADPRRQPFARLLQQAWRRYGKPLVVAETSHCGSLRAPWLDEIAAQTLAAQASGVRVQGLCLYPLIDRPDWNDPQHWHHSGLWDALGTASAVAAGPGGPLPMARRLADDYARALARWQQRLR